MSSKLTGKKNEKGGYYVSQTLWTLRIVHSPVYKNFKEHKNQGNEVCLSRLIPLFGLGRTGQIHVGCSILTKNIKISNPFLVFLL